MKDSSKHFANHSALEHLKEAREKGQGVFSEVHGLEPSGCMIALLDSAKTTVILLLTTWTLLFLFATPFSIASLFLFALSFGLLFLHTGRSAYLGWARLERLHRLIEEERWEIEHHKEQEKEELIEMYEAKGFQEPLLSQVIETLMADDNRLLEVMLTEELAIPLEAYEHPLKQGVYALIGSSISVFLFFLGRWISPFYGPIIISFGIVISASLLFAKIQKNEKMRACIWNLSLFGMIVGGVYLLGRFLQNVL